MHSFKVHKFTMMNGPGDILYEKNNNSILKGNILSMKININSAKYKNFIFMCSTFKRILIY